MGCTKEQIIVEMKRYVGCKLGDKTHKDIIDTYNAFKGKKEINYQAAWCATTVSAAAIKCNATDIIPVDCYCPTQLQSFKNKDCWLGKVKPQPGDIVYFDWNNNAVPDHVGIVESVSGNMVTSIEGNYSDTDSCQRRTFPYHWKFVIGYARPKYKTATQTYADPMKKTNLTATLKSGDSGENVKKLQDALNRCKDRLKIKLYDYVKEDGNFGEKTLTAVEKIQAIHGLAVDGVAGSNTNSVLNQNYSPLVLPTETVSGGSGLSVARLQTALNIAKLIQGNKTKYARTYVTGSWNSDTAYALTCFQSGNGLVSDCIAGAKTWACLRKVLNVK